MARGNGGRGSNGTGSNSTIRFIMLEANLADGDFSQITQAITNALRPPSAPAPRLIGTPARGVEVGSVVTEVEEPPVGGEEAGVDEPVTSPSARTESRPRKYRSPKVVSVDLTSAPAFAEFAAEKDPANDQKRYLVVATWFKQARNIDEINMDHVYTCYRAVKWPTAIDDFDAPLRALKSRQLLDKGKGRGMYAINHLGVAEVDALGAAKAE